MMILRVSLRIQISLLNKEKSRSLKVSIRLKILMIIFKFNMIKMLPNFLQMKLGKSKKDFRISKRPIMTSKALMLKTPIYRHSKRKERLPKDLLKSRNHMMMSKALMHKIKI